MTFTEVTNVWASEAKSPEEAIMLQHKADLLIKLRHIIHENGWSQKVAANELGITQNRVSYINTGNVRKFSTDRLIELLAKSGYQISISIAAA